jgi:hypothetical protein
MCAQHSRRTSAGTVRRRWASSSRARAGALLQVVAQGHQVGAAIAAPGAVPVDDAAYPPAVHHDVVGMEVDVDEVVAGQRSAILKQRPARAWLTAHADPADANESVHHARKLCIRP